jgi:hypothetical protein
MLFAGLAWYRAVPGVTQTGPFNPHFVKDIGAAYLTAGLGLAWFGWRASGFARGLAVAGALFLALHALIHIVEALGDPGGPAHLVRDFPGVFLPALIAIAVVWPLETSRETAHA